MHVIERRMYWISLLVVVLLFANKVDELGGKRESKQALDLASELNGM